MMKKKLGVITIGQSPRTDVVPEMVEYLGKNVEVIEKGALDGLSYEKILSFYPKEDDYVLVSRLKDGTSVKMAKRYIIPRLQQCIHDLEEEVHMILFICTGTFPEIFVSNKPIIYPQKILYSVTKNLINKGKLAVIIPDRDQINQSKRKWQETGLEINVVAASPYKEEDEIEDAILKLKDVDFDLVVMDCIGYDRKMKKKIAYKLRKPVILARTLVARVIGEMLDME